MGQAKCHSLSLSLRFHKVAHQVSFWKDAIHRGKLTWRPLWADGWTSQIFLSCGSSQYNDKMSRPCSCNLHSKPALLCHSPAHLGSWGGRTSTPFFFPFMVQDKPWHNYLAPSSQTCRKSTACLGATQRENSWSFDPPPANLTLTKDWGSDTNDNNKKAWIKCLHHWGPQSRAILLWLWSRHGCGTPVHQRQGWRLSIFSWEGWGPSILFCWS